MLFYLVFVRPFKSLTNNVSIMVMEIFLASANISSLGFFQYEGDK
jgi:hypothetical protein